VPPVETPPRTTGSAAAAAAGGGAISGSGRGLELVVFSVGVSTLGAEIAAARLLAPYFGASTIVWANTIATVLVALSIGYWLGGRIGDRHPHIGALARWVLASSFLVALVPFVARPVLRTAVSAFDRIDVGAAAGSLFGVLVLVAVPILVLGAVAPWAIRLRVQRVEDAGRMAGRLYAISTFGSLLGTFAAALALIPLVGTQRTFVLFALLLAFSAALLLPRRYLLAPALMCVLLALPVGQTKEAENGRVLHERETEYQYARVVEQPDGERWLELNEGQAIHSIFRPGSVLTENVWDGYLALPFSVLGRAPRSVAILGNGAGTTVRAYGRYFPRTAIDGVEIDPELTEIGRRFFELRDRPGLRLIGDDARPFLRRTDRRYEAIFVDAYRQPYIPFYLTTVEFFRLVRSRLEPGGVVVVNAGHPEGSDALERVLAAGIADAMSHVARHPITGFNTLLVGADTAPSPRRLSTAAAGLPVDLRPVFTHAAANLEPARTSGRAYTDDRAPVEWLIDRSIVEFAAGGG
jgi:spermidine synthase